jgi:microcystin-dependent protein
MKKAKMLKIVLFIVSTVFIFLSIPQVYCGVPQLINYQGKLSDKNGVAVPDGNYNVQFKIYDVASGGTALWSETWNATTSQIKTVSGVFDALLGTFQQIPLTFFSQHQTTYLSITVGTDPEMTPRIKITSVGYAFEAGNGVPRGAIIMWSGAINQIPSGWALCDGTNGTPDLRDRFIMGAGNNYAIGDIGGESSHVLTVTEMPVHTHIQNAHGHQMLVQGNDGTTRTRGGGVGTSYTVDSGVLQSTATNQNAGGGAGHNNLPPYYALAFIIKL